jgi:hypothetical protein
VIIKMSMLVSNDTDLFTDKAIDKLIDGHKGVVVMKQGSKYAVISGILRHRVYKDMGVEAIECKVVEPIRNKDGIIKDFR